MSIIARCLLVLVLTSLPQVALLAQTADKGSKTPPVIGKLVDVGGYRVHLYCTGTGSPTVVILGAGFSFDWGLVQPEVARFTRVCTYDHSGIGWSDSGPKDSCSLRVKEAHLALKKAEILGPYVLVGHSLGALVARLYTDRYPDEVVGMVFVDHAHHAFSASPTDDATVLAPLPIVASTPSSRDGAASALTEMERDPFHKLPTRDRELHQWAMAQPQIQMAFQTNVEISSQCAVEADALAKKNPSPLGDRPLINVSINMFRITEYVQLQAKLLSLSKSSKEIVADKSTHLVIIDRPEVVVDAINQVVQSVRNHTPLLSAPLPTQ